MDTDRSGKVTPREFQSWAAKMGLVLTDRQCQLILGDYYNEEGIDLSHFIQFIDNLENNNYTHQQQEQNPLSRMQWEVLDKDAIRQRRLAVRAISEQTTIALQNAFHQCSDDAKTDHDILETLSSQLLTKRTSLLKAFEKADEDHSGKLDAKELQMALSSMGGIHVSLERAQSLVSKFDRDGDGKLSKSDFVSCISMTANDKSTTATEIKKNDISRGLDRPTSSSRATETTLTSMLFPTLFSLLLT